MNALTASILLALSGGAPVDPGPTLEAFLLARKEHKLAGITAALVLENIVDPIPVEVVGTSKGVIQIGDAKRYLFEGTGGTWIGTAPPAELAALLRRGVTSRWIGMGTRTRSGLEVDLLAAVENYIAAHYDERAAAVAAMPSFAPRNPIALLEESLIREPGDPAHLYADFIIRQNAALETREAEEIAILTLAMSRRYGLDPRLTVSVMLVESGLNPKSKTPDGRLGLSGLPSFMLRTFALTDPFDLRQAIWCACKRLSNGFSAARPAADRLEAALSGYRNMGIDGLAIPPAEPDAGTRAFIDSVSKWYKTLSGTN